MGVIRRKSKENELQGDLSELIKKGSTIVAVVPDRIAHYEPFTYTVVEYRIYYLSPVTTWGS